MHATTHIRSWANGYPNQIEQVVTRCPCVLEAIAAESRRDGLIHRRVSIQVPLETS